MLLKLIQCLEFKQMICFFLIPGSPDELLVIPVTRVFPAAKNNVGLLSPKIALGNKYSSVSFGIFGIPNQC